LWNDEIVRVSSTVPLAGSITSIRLDEIWRQIRGDDASFQYLDRGT
jgi:hypothetical protein